jgi:NAD(P)H-hydrate epimerase
MMASIFFISRLCERRQPRDQLSVAASQPIPPFLLLTAEETRAVEAAAVRAGLSQAAMMESAGGAAAAFIIRNMTKGPVSVLCGPGKNGGDGFVVARKLKDEGWPVRVALLGERGALEGDAALMASLFDGEVGPMDAGALDGAAVIVDALFGIGLARPLQGEARAIIEAANAHPARIVALDLPSGVDADTGAVLGVAADAAATVTFIAKKPGHLLFPGRALAGHVALADLGVKAEWTAGVAPATYENDPALFGPRWPRPTHATHKYSRGHVAVVSGPRLATGAARLAALSALRAGAGLVTVLSPKSAADENAAHLTAVMVRETEGSEAIGAALADRRFTAALIGPGAGVHDGTKNSVLEILRSRAGAVLDADALTAFQSSPEALFSALRPNDVLTPHAGEFARLFPELGSHDRLKAARAAAVRAQAVIVLKGADTVIAAPDGRAAVNSNAPYQLATAGAGDVLGGLIAGLLAQGMSGFDAACAGVWLHGAAAQIAGPGLIAEDLPNALPTLFRTLFAQAPANQSPNR